MSFEIQKVRLQIKDKFFNKNNFMLIAGPCAIESKEHAFEIASFLNSFGLSFFKGGIYKPRTSPYTFQGLGREGLSILSHIKKEYGFIVCSEIMDVREIEYALEIVDIFQVGARNMQNFSLLVELGKLREKPILLKRGFSSTVKEWILSSEYILKEGNNNVIFCERGIRTFEDSTRNTLDFSSILVIKEKTGLPVIVDPSHASGNRNYVIPLSKGAIASGADGLLIDVYRYPDQSLVDGQQSLDYEMFKELFHEMSKMLLLMNKNLYIL